MADDIILNSKENGKIWPLENDRVIVFINGQASISNKQDERKHTIASDISSVAEDYILAEHCCIKLHIYEQ